MIFQTQYLPLGFTQKVLANCVPPVFVNSCLGLAHARAEHLLTSSDPTQNWVIPKLESEPFQNQQLET
jgi:hypothetical protein